MAILTIEIKICGQKLCKRMVFANPVTYYKVLKLGQILHAHKTGSVSL